MKTKLAFLMVLVPFLAFCDGGVVVYRERRPPPVIVEQPAPVVVADPAPYYVEEGAYVDGVVVVAPAVIDEYVFIGGGWYYWHPGFRCWVHAHRPAGWRPDVRIRVDRDWHEHPMYRRDDRGRGEGEGRGRGRGHD